MSLLRLDHFAMSCTDLLDTAAVLEDQLGAPFAPRGEHPHMGTHNRLLSLGSDIYFELIAIDPDAQAPDRPRWFDIDNFAGHARLTNWIVATDDMDTALAELPDGMGDPISLTRADYHWDMAVPETGLLPFDGWAPALIQWHGDAHPAPNLPDHNIRLETLTLFHPKAEEIAEAFAPHLPRDTMLFAPSNSPSLEARLSTPKGEVILA